MRLALTPSVDTHSSTPFAASIAALPAVGISFRRLQAVVEFRWIDRWSFDGLRNSCCLLFLPVTTTGDSSVSLLLMPVASTTSAAVEDRLQSSTAPWSIHGDRLTMLVTVRKQGKPLEGWTLHWRSVSPSRASPVVRVWCRRPPTAGMAGSLHKVTGSYWKAPPAVTRQPLQHHLMDGLEQWSRGSLPADWARSLHKKTRLFLGHLRSLFGPTWRVVLPLNFTP